MCIIIQRVSTAATLKLRRSVCCRWYAHGSFVLSSVLSITVHSLLLSLITIKLYTTVQQICTLSVVCVILKF